MIVLEWTVLTVRIIIVFYSPEMQFWQNLSDFLKIAL